MTLVTNAKNTYEAKGLREDLANIIYNISPDETPLFSGSGRSSAKAVVHEWQTDTLRAAISTNAQLEGDEIASFDSRAASARVGNYCQISRVLVSVSGTVEKVDKAGRASEMGYQIAKAGRELKTDLEKNAFENIAGDAGGATTARKTAALGAWIKTNTSKGASGVDPTYTSGVPSATRTDGTTRAITEGMLKTVISAIFTAGGKMDTLYVHPTNKPVISAFTGIATRNYDITQPKPTAIIASASVYVGEFGTLKIVPNRFMRLRDLYLIDHEYVDFAFLRPIFLKDLADTADAEKKALMCEWALKVKNEAAHGLVADSNGT
jgi:hypothetical protein